MWVTTGRVDTIAGEGRCTSSQRPSNPGPPLYHAWRHSLSLDERTRVTVDVGSADANASSLDSYVLLIEGRSSHESGLVRGRNDDGGPGTDSLLAGVDLAPGDYTVEATTFGTREAGGYDVTVTGAYGYSMGAPYNRIGRPAVVFVACGDARLVIRRETVDDMLALDVV